MTRKPMNPGDGPQTGGITILVALILLVLLTVAAAGMSRNSFREIVNSGTVRQGSQVRNVADAGIEWSIYWLDIQNSTNAADTALKMRTLKQTLLQNDTLAGFAYDVNTQAQYVGPPSVSTLQADNTYPVVNDTTQGFSIALTRMGKLPVTDISQGVTQGTFTPAQGSESKLAPDLWAVRSDGQLQVGSGTFAPGFIHSKEAWISTPVQ
ncbi:MAG: hypothetical protein U0P81_12675 [Holophagaceae bacterium]